MPPPDTVTVNPDGVDILVDMSLLWRIQSASVFIPCVNTKAAVLQMQEIFHLPHIKDVKHRVDIEAGRYGVRIWSPLCYDEDSSLS